MVYKLQLKTLIMKSFNFDTKCPAGSKAHDLEKCTCQMSAFKEFQHFQKYLIKILFADTLTGGIRFSLRLKIAAVLSQDLDNVNLLI